jgi:hypothetical protein
MLAECKASLAAQTDKDFEHVILEDRIGVGVGESHRQFWTLDANGEYVLVLDDDNLITDERFVERLKRLCQSKPDLVVCRIDRLGDIYPLVWPPKCGEVDVMNVVVSRELWERCRHEFGLRYEGDFDFISALLRTKPAVAMLDGVVGKIRQVGLGRPESHNILGHRIRIVVSCAGIDFVHYQGETIVATERNAGHLDSLLRAGHAEDLDAPQKRTAAEDKILVFCPTARLERETIQALVNQQGIERCDLMFT